MGKRNGIKYHGKTFSEVGLYTAMPVELTRDRNLSLAGGRVACWLWSHADEFEVSRNSVAEALGINVRTATKAFDNLEMLRWMVRQPVVTEAGKKAFGYRFHLQRERPFSVDEVAALSMEVVAGSVSSLQDRTNGGAESALDLEHKVPSPLGQEVPSKEVHLLEVHREVQKIEIRSSQADDPMSDQGCKEAIEAAAIPDDWHPNGVHVGTAQKNGLHAVAIGRVFKAWATDTGERSTDWDKKFGHLLREISDLETQAPEDQGFSSLAEYSMSGELDWYDYPPYALESADMSGTLATA